MSSSPRLFLMSQVFLRVMAMALSAAALAVLLTSDQPIFIGVQYYATAHYAYSSAFRFIAIADAIVCGGSVLSLIILFVLVCRGGKPTSSNGFLIYAFVFDQSLASLMLAACSAATAVGMIGRFGLKQNSWVPICGRASKFCNKMTVSVAFSFVSSFCYGILALMAVIKKTKQENKNNLQA